MRTRVFENEQRSAGYMHGFVASIDRFTRAMHRFAGAMIAFVGAMIGFAGTMIVFAGAMIRFLKTRKILAVARSVSGHVCHQNRADKTEFWTSREDFGRLRKENLKIISGPINGSIQNAFLEGKPIKNDVRFAAHWLVFQPGGDVVAAKLDELILAARR